METPESVESPESRESAESIILKLKSLSNPDTVAGMARFGITQKNTLGIAIPVLRNMARETGKNHALALKLWDSGIHEARILASMVDNPGEVTGKQMDCWVKEFDSWDVCDQVCMNLFRKTPFAYAKASKWSVMDAEFVKRAGFAMMACLASGDKKAGDRQFEDFIPLIKQGATDERNFVKKAVNWALRQIGKRNTWLNTKAIAAAREMRAMQKTGSKSVRWIATDALRELEGAAVRKRLRKYHASQF